MTKIQNSKQKNKKNGFGPCLEFEIWNLRPAHSCPRPPRLARPPSAAPQANARRAWLAGELAMAGGFICNLMLVIWHFLVIWCLEFGACLFFGAWEL